MTLGVARLGTAIVAATLALGCAAAPAVTTQPPTLAPAPTATQAPPSVASPVTPTAAAPAPTVTPPTATAAPPTAVSTPSPATPTVAPATPIVTPAPPTPAPTPGPTSIDIRPFLTSQVRVVNLADVTLSVTISAFDPVSTEHELGTFEIEPFQVVTQAAAAARYRFEFGLIEGRSETCLIEIAEGELISFGLLAEGVVIVFGNQPANPAQMVVSTSSRCSAGADA